MVRENWDVLVRRDAFDVTDVRDATTLSSSPARCGCRSSGSASRRTACVVRLPGRGRQLLGRVPGPGGVGASPRLGLRYRRGLPASRPRRRHPRIRVRADVHAIHRVARGHLRWFLRLRSAPADDASVLPPLPRRRARGRARRDQDRRPTPLSRLADPGGRRLREGRRAQRPCNRACHQRLEQDHARLGPRAGRLVAGDATHRLTCTGKLASVRGTGLFDAVTT